MNEIIYDIWFSELDIENQIKLKLLENCSSKQLWKFTEKDLKKYKIEKNAINKILCSKSLNEYELKYKIMEKQNIKLINVQNVNYPNRLKNIENMPAYIYYRGNIDVANSDYTAGIVGCRKSTNFGNELARKFSKELAENNIVIVSGLAIGIDKYAHLGALDAENGKTIAVLGGGIDDDSIYPMQNKRVFDRILENGGLIISEYGIFSEPLQEHFPARNRIISGLSDKVIVVEAKEKSGSLITAGYALEQGKDLYAVPRKCVLQKLYWNK